MPRCSNSSSRMRRNSLNNSWGATSYAVGLASAFFAGKILVMTPPAPARSPQHSTPGSLRAWRNISSTIPARTPTALGIRASVPYAARRAIQPRVWQQSPVRPLRSDCWLPAHRRGAPGKNHSGPLRFLRRAPEERGHIKIIRGSGIFLVNHFVDGGTLLCFLRGVMRLDGLFVAPGFPCLREVRGLLVRLPARRLTESRGNDGDLHLFFHGIIHYGAEDNVGVLMRGLLDDRRGLVNFVEGEAGRSADVDENALRALDRIVFEQRAVDGAIGGVYGAIGTGSDGGAHDGVPLPLHDGPYIGKVAIDDPRDCNNVADALHGLAKNIVGDAECFEEACSGFDRLHQPLVGDDNHGVHAADEFGERLLGLLLAALAFERERLGDHGDRERAELAGQRRDDGSSAAAGASAEAGGEKNHVRPFERLDDLVGVFERGFAAHLGIRARAGPCGELSADLQLDGRL